MYALNLVLFDRFCSCVRCKEKKLQEEMIWYYSLLIIRCFLCGGVIYSHTHTLTHSSSHPHLQFPNTLSNAKKESIHTHTLSLSHSLSHPTPQLPNATHNKSRRRLSSIQQITFLSLHYYQKNPVDSPCGQRRSQSGCASPDLPHNTESLTGREVRPEGWEGWSEECITFMHVWNPFWFCYEFV